MCRVVNEAQKIPIATLAERIEHVVQCCFNGRRIVIFSGGAFESDEKLLEEVQGVQDGGGYGSIIGRNSFQRPEAESRKLLGRIMDIYGA